MPGLARTETQQVGEGLHLRLRTHHEYIGRQVGERDRHEILDRVVGQIRQQGLMAMLAAACSSVWPSGAVAWQPRPRPGLRRARSILDDEWLAESDFQFTRQEARQDRSARPW